MPKFSGRASLLPGAPCCGDGPPGAAILNPPGTGRKGIPLQEEAVESMGGIEVRPHDLASIVNALLDFFGVRRAPKTMVRPVPE